MEQIINFIMDHAELTIAVSVFILAEIIKAGLGSKHDNYKQYIPAFAGLAGIILYVWSQDGAFTFKQFYIGLLSGWAATGGFEFITKTFRKEDVADDSNK